MTSRAKDDTKDAEYLADLLRAHREKLRQVHEKDAQAGLPGVWLPEGLERKYPQAGVATTQLYTHVMRKPGPGVRSPLDG